MTRDQAIAIRTAQLQGQQVDPQLLQAAIKTIADTNTPHTDLSFAKALRHAKREAEGRPVRSYPAPRVESPPAPACPCSENCPADPPAVVKALKPWALVTPANPPENPESYVWPRPE